MNSKKGLLLISVVAGLVACGSREEAGSNAAAANISAIAPVAPVNAEPSVSVPSTTNAVSEAEAAPVLGIDGEGLRWVDPASGAARALPFGTPRSAMLSALAAVGKPEFGAQEECGEGPIKTASYPNGLALHFQDDKFAGWFLDKDASKNLTTMSGLGIGSTRAELNGAYEGVKVEESTIGNEFFAGDMGGLVDGMGQQAKITALWAGVACIFR